MVISSSPSQNACTRTPYIRSSTAGNSNCGILYIASSLAAMQAVIAVFSFFLYHQWQVNKLSDVNLGRYGGVLAFSSFVSSVGNVSLTTSHGINGVGSYVGSIFFLCWTCFVLSMYVCLRYVDVLRMQNTEMREEEDLATATSRGSSFTEEDKFVSRLDEENTYFGSFLHEDESSSKKVKGLLMRPQDKSDKSPRFKRRIKGLATKKPRRQARDPTPTPPANRCSGSKSNDFKRRYYIRSGKQRRRRRSISSQRRSQPKEQTKE